MLRSIIHVSFHIHRTYTRHIATEQRGSEQSLHTFLIIFTGGLCGTDLSKLDPDIRAKKTLAELHKSSFHCIDGLFPEISFEQCEYNDETRVIGLTLSNTF